MRVRTKLCVLLSVPGIALTGAVATAAPSHHPGKARHAHHRVLRVGSWHGKRGQYKTIQSAVDAAHRGDWILVGPGDYKERGDFTSHKPSKTEAGYGVTITTPGLHLRGMNRRRVVVDGTKPGSPTCSARRKDQNFGSTSEGRSGIVALQANRTSIENLTVCNFLGQGNQIWWNGGDGSGKVGMNRYHGAYLSATTTYFNAKDPQGTYGIFVSNARGRGVIRRTYASNMNDSSYYIGACANCHAVLDRAWAEHSALGYSGTNSGGHLVIERSRWDDNASGIVSNSQNNDDAPSPQDGACPSGHGSCEIWRHNNVYNNNDPNVPQDSGAAGAGPVGTGMVIAGGRNDTLVHNRVHNNGAWGIITVPYPDTETPPTGVGQHCNGGADDFDLSTFGLSGTVPCYYSDWGSKIAHNRFKHNGFFGNATNGDIADLSTVPPEDASAPANCWHGNTNGSGDASSWPVTLQTTQKACGGHVYPDSASDAALTAQVSCDSGLLFSCPSGSGLNYPQTTKTTIKPLPKHLKTKPHPCAGVPTNPWCPRSGGHHKGVHKAVAFPAARPAASSSATSPATRTVTGAELAAAGLVILGGAAARRRRHRTATSGSATA